MISNDFASVIRDVSRSLEAAGIEYAVTGSIASSIHGEPVYTHDIDIVVSMTPQQARALKKQLPTRFYADEDAMVEAAERRTQTNLIEQKTQLKVDLSVLPSREYSRILFQRRITISLEEKDDPKDRFFVVSPEDIILMKLDWRRESRSTKQWNNALSVLRVHGARLDWKYLFEQARALGIESDLTALRDEGGV